MEKKIEGAWLIHHSRKIQATNNRDFDQIAFAGKAGALLSALSASTQDVLPLSKVNALAKAGNISPRGELPLFLSELERQRLIQVSDSHIEVLGLTSQSVLEHTSTIFHEGNPEAFERAVLDISEQVSEKPIPENLVKERLGDEYGLGAADARNLVSAGKEIGFFDAEDAGSSGHLLFNGNLFRRAELGKVNAVLQSLSGSEAAKAREVGELLQKNGCLSLQKVTNILGVDLFNKLHSIGLFDVNSVGNELGQHRFVTRPAAFSKFSDSLADDALDLAKALVTSLTYGMTQSSYHRGRIQMISLLMQKLIAGGTVGPATAIGKDYQALELKRVVEVTPVPSTSMFNMRLLKPEVGRLALAVIEEGDVVSQTLAQLPGASVTRYVSPEENREFTRKNVPGRLRSSIATLLDDIRTGGLSR